METSSLKKRCYQSILRRYNQIITCVNIRRFHIHRENMRNAHISYLNLEDMYCKTMYPETEEFTLTEDYILNSTEIKTQKKTTTNDGMEKDI